MRRCRFLFSAIFLLSLLQTSLNGEEVWRVGLSKAVITPDETTWLSGYANRTRPADGKVHDLYAKAAAFQGPDGTQLVLVTLDLGSVNVHMTNNVAERVEKQFKLPRASLIFNCSHTHCAPEVAAERRFFHNLSDSEEAKLAHYIEQCDDKLVDLIGNALADRQPAKLTICHSTTGFAFNRRSPTGINENGPTDREVPVLCVTDLQGQVRGILFGYACHNTTLDFQLYCGDYAGFAQYDLEQSHPGAVAMFIMGCGGDQNPQPRHGINGLEYAKQHGRELADAVEQSLAGKQQTLPGPLRVAYDLATLDLEPLPPIDRLRAESQLDESTAAQRARSRKAKYLLGLIDSGAEVPLMQSCPLHVARFGDELLMIFISGETVVDYSLRCKREFAGPYVWVAGYCDDVFAYLPSRRVLVEGGYEGRDGNIYRLMATSFMPNVEDRVMSCIAKLVKATGGT